MPTGKVSGSRISALRRKALSASVRAAGRSLTVAGACRSWATEAAASLKEDPPELSGTSQAISPGLARIVHRCLEKRAGDRFHSAHDLALALEAVSSGVSRPDAAVAVGLAKRHKTASLVTLAAMLLVAGGLYRGLVHSPAPPVAEAASCGGETAPATGNLPGSRGSG